MRAVLDANVLISAVLSPRGTPARLLLAWQAGAFELVVSPQLMAELRRALAYPKLARLVPPADADAFAAWLGPQDRVADESFEVSRGSPRSPRWSAEGSHAPRT